MVSISLAYGSVRDRPVVCKKYCSMLFTLNFRSCKWMSLSSICTYWVVHCAIFWQIVARLACFASRAPKDCVPPYAKGRAGAPGTHHAVKQVLQAGSCGWSTTECTVPTQLAESPGLSQPETSLLVGLQKPAHKRYVIREHQAKYVWVVCYGSINHWEGANVKQLSPLKHSPGAHMCKIQFCAPGIDHLPTPDCLCPCSVLVLMGYGPWNNSGTFLTIFCVSLPWA